MKTKYGLRIIAFLIFIIMVLGCYNEYKKVLVQFISENPKMLVCSVHILTNQESLFNEESSLKIVDFINEKGYAKAQLTELLPPANNEWRPNEAKMLTESIKLFIEYVNTQNLEDNTYILYVEFLKSGEIPSVKAVHYCLLNNVGEIAMRGLLNSRWEEFQDIMPETNDDCVKVFMNGFENKMNN